MSDPNMDAADLQGSIEARAWADFSAWCDARHPDRADMEALAEEYAQDCESGAWPVESMEPKS